MCVLTQNSIFPFCPTGCELSDTPAAFSGERSSPLNANGAEARRQAGVRSNEFVRDVHDGATHSGAETHLAPRSRGHGPREREAKGPGAFEV